MGKGEKLVEDIAIKGENNDFEKYKKDLEQGATLMGLELDREDADPFVVESIKRMKRTGELSEEVTIENLTSEQYAQIVGEDGIRQLKIHNYFEQEAGSPELVSAQKEIVERYEKLRDEVVRESLIKIKRENEQAEEMINKLSSSGSEKYERVIGEAKGQLEVILKEEILKLNDEVEEKIAGLRRKESAEKGLITKRFNKERTEEEKLFKEGANVNKTDDGLKIEYTKEQKEQKFLEIVGVLQKQVDAIGKESPRTSEHLFKKTKIKANDEISYDASIEVFHKTLQGINTGRRNKEAIDENKLKFLENSMLAISHSNVYTQERHDEILRILDSETFRDKSTGNLYTNLLEGLSNNDKLKPSFDFKYSVIFKGILKEINDKEKTETLDEWQYDKYLDKKIRALFVNFQNQDDILGALSVINNILEDPRAREMINSNSSINNHVRGVMEELFSKEKEMREYFISNEPYDSSKMVIRKGKKTIDWTIENAIEDKHFRKMFEENYNNGLFSENLETNNKILSNILRKLESMQAPSGTWEVTREQKTASEMVESFKRDQGDIYKLGEKMSYSEEEEMLKEEGLPDSRKKELEEIIKEKKETAELWEHICLSMDVLVTGEVSGRYMYYQNIDKLIERINENGKKIGLSQDSIEKMIGAGHSIDDKKEWMERRVITNVLKASKATGWKSQGLIYASNEESFSFGDIARVIKKRGLDIDIGKEVIEGIKSDLIQLNNGTSKGYLVMHNPGHFIKNIKILAERYYGKESFEEEIEKIQASLNLKDFNINNVSQLDERRVVYLVNRAKERKDKVIRNDYLQQALKFAEKVNLKKEMLAKFPELQEVA